MSNPTIPGMLIQKGGIYTLIQPVNDPTAIKLVAGPGNHVTRAKSAAHEVVPRAADPANGNVIAVIVEVREVLTFKPAMVCADEPSPPPAPEPAPAPIEEPEPREPVVIAAAAVNARRPSSSHELAVPEPQP